MTEKVDASGTETISTHAVVKIDREGEGANGSTAQASGAGPEMKAKRPTFGRGPGLSVTRFFTKAGVDPFDTVEWETRTARISGERGETVFEQPDVEVPVTWSQLATNVVASKYFRGPLGSPSRERSVRQLIGRVVDTVQRWGDDCGYFATPEDRDAFGDELKYLLLHQHVSFNSPVWFNIGIEKKPQASACFIVSVKDTMQSILELAKTEGMIFKFGSGSGTNLSSLRSSKEDLSGGGKASGPVSFMRGFDSFAGVIKSGGKTRRAAKMVILNIDHPDIEEFIECKEREERKAWALIEAGYDPGFDVPGGAYDSVMFQNANHSVRVTDDFMQAVVDDLPWHTRAVTDGRPMQEYRARDLFHRMAQAAWVCGDPGIQYHDTTNRWHTCANTGPIRASNPCSEYVFLDDSACNLASLNLMKFRDERGNFDIERFRAAVRVTITAQEIFVDNASYPTEAIAQNSYDYRPLGLGYANLGALLMARGIPYDDERGRAYAAAITAIMTGEAYRQSGVIAEKCGGPFPGFAKNAEPCLRVMKQHRAAVEDIDSALCPEGMVDAARSIWDDVVHACSTVGLRNAQTTVLAPTGTIGFMMDCDTTGVEPDIALVKYKSLVGGGVMKIVNQTVPEALRTLGYEEDAVQEILEHIDKNDTIEDAPRLREEHLPVFDCAFRPLKGTRSIAPMGHIRMMAAVQPFLSGAISKTVNVPNDATVEDIQDLYMEGWRMGLKALAIYRDGCKRTQPLSTGKPAEAAGQASRPVRRRLPAERQSLTHKFSVGGHEGYITVGLFEDGTPGEIFITMSKEGSVISGLMDCFATSISLALQYGVPLKTLVEKFSHTRFEPSGYTGNKEIPFAKSIMDYLFRWLALRFLPNDLPTPSPSLEEVSAIGMQRDPEHKGSALIEQERQVFMTQADAPPCPDCGMIMVRNAACYRCMNCGLSYGCG
ncbi:MAG: ribonucleoside-diphosphate reductase subunit alpha [Fimbriimonadales bacterium]